ncbi:COMM domain-containing protein 4 [Hydra vulgaris]|uniref:COMM domain-containing protein 4 n=1 Tax=Hydra vulgaris TaxID=6087 RepID=A0ABM4DNS2_HYDVU
MRFRFCGDLDCPDWVLAEISILSRISSVKLKLFCQQVMLHLLGGSIDYNKVNKFTADAKLEINDIKAAIAAVDFIFTNSAKYQVNSEILSNELQQLGLPKELAISMCKVLDENAEKLYSYLKQNSFRLSRMERFDWRVDYVLSSSHQDEINEAEIQILIKKQSNESLSETVTFSCTNEKLRCLLADLKYAYKLIEDLSL